MNRLALPFLLFLIAQMGVLANTAPGPTAPDLGLTLRQLERWTKSPAQSVGRKLAEGAELLQEVDRLWSGQHADDSRILYAMLDFLGRSIALARIPEALISGPRTGDVAEVNEWGLRNAAREMLRRRLDLFRTELTLGILLGTGSAAPHPTPRRAASCEVLAEDHSPGTTMALLSSTRGRHGDEPVPRALMESAIDALVGRQEEGVHLRLLALLERSDESQEAFFAKPIETHFASFLLKPGSERTKSALSLQAAKDLRNSDWRRASRGVVLSQALPDELAFPLLIGALETWEGLGQAHEGPTRRVLGELLTQLESRSGRHLGLQPSRWRAFWDAFLRGEELPSGTSSGKTMGVGGSFFGLRAETDHLVFLLDRSGSMNAPFGEDTRHRRLDEAALQMESLLGHLGPRTHFSVVVFNDEAQTWELELQLANAVNVEAASAWVRGSKAARGTHLFTGLREVLRIEPSKPGPASHPPLADTVVVLCDGETQEGPTWVEPLLRLVNDQARLVVHTVQLGPGGDGTLEALAGLTGGQFHRYED